MLWLVVVCVGLLFFMRYASAQSNGALVLRICVDKRINLERMHNFLSQHALEVVDAVCDPQRDTLKCSWRRLHFTTHEASIAFRSFPNFYRYPHVVRVPNPNADAIYRPTKIEFKKI